MRCVVPHLRVLRLEHVFGVLLLHELAQRHPQVGLKTVELELDGLPIGGAAGRGGDERAAGNRFRYQSPDSPRRAPNPR